MPIDHGLSIPDSLAISSYEIAWLGFSQAEQPFSEECLEYISRIDIRKDLKMLESLLPFREVCLRNMRISTLLLQVGARMGLTLAQIGGILCRPDEDDQQPSILETLVSEAEKSKSALSMPAIKKRSLSEDQPNSSSLGIQKGNQTKSQAQLESNPLTPLHWDERFFSTLETLLVQKIK